MFKNQIFINMKTKNLLVPVVTLFWCSCFGQVGINTTTPESSLDVRAKNHLGTVSANDGILVPRVSSLITNGSVNGQLVYLINDAGGFTKGFHYWDGSQWVGLNGAAGAGDPSSDVWVDNAGGTAVLSSRPVVIGSSVTADTSSVLDMSSINNKGILIPKVSLTSTTDATTVNSPATGLLVYNTTTTSDVTQSLYINNGTSASPQWTKIFAQNLVTGLGVIGIWSGPSSNAFTGTITSVTDGISFRSSINSGYQDSIQLTSGTASIIAIGSEEGSNGWFWKGQNATTVNSSVFTNVDSLSGTGMGNGRRIINVINTTNGNIYRINFLLDNGNAMAYYYIEKVK